MPLTIATWNVNSIRARKDRVLGWLDKHKPDVLCLQEIKVEDAQFPVRELDELGYYSETYGQKAYNGVALLSRTKMTDLQRGFVDSSDDTQARFLAATVQGVRVMSLYVPNGERPGSVKFNYKLEWFGRLQAYLQSALRPEHHAVLCGDFNVAPADLDVWDPVQWRNQILCTPIERQALERIMAIGLVDVARKLHPDAKLYTFWDYGVWAFAKDRGLRIDHILATTGLAEKVTSVTVDKEARREVKGGDKPSDHAPLVAVFDV
jgi:exodeoxyribonuclease III